MKKILILMLLATFTAATHAQAVFTEIKEMAQKQLNDPNTSAIVKETSRFKIDALNYLGMKMKEVMPDSSAAYLDEQAYALYSFTNLYNKSMNYHRSAPQKEQLANIKLFIDASLSCPLFRDKDDEEYVLIYFKNPESPTRFSLDTNWIHAYLLVAEKFKK